METNYCFCNGNHQAEDENNPIVIVGLMGE